MMYKCFTVWDAKAKLHLQPFFSRSIPEALRSIRNLCLEDGHTFNVNSEDYSLLCIGEYSEEAGTLHPEKTPFVLCRLEQLKSGQMDENVDLQRRPPKFGAAAD